MNEKLKHLLQQRKDYKLIEKENESYVITNDFDMQEKYFIAKKLRKKTEKQIFKILEDDINK